MAGGSACTTLKLLRTRALSVIHRLFDPCSPLRSPPSDVPGLQIFNPPTRNGKVKEEDPCAVGLRTRKDIRFTGYDSR